MFKDFFYLWFLVDTDKSSKCFLNYQKAKEYYHGLGDVNKSYYGVHLWKGTQCFHQVINFRTKFIARTKEPIELNTQFNVDAEL